MHDFSSKRADDVARAAFGARWLSALVTATQRLGERWAWFQRPILKFRLVAKRERSGQVSPPERASGRERASVPKRAGDSGRASGVA